MKAHFSPRLLLARFFLNIPQRFLHFFRLIPYYQLMSFLHEVAIDFKIEKGQRRLGLS